MSWWVGAVSPAVTSLTTDEFAFAIKTLLGPKVGRF